MKLPTLFKKTSTGAIQQWDISAGESLSSPGFGVIITRHGQVDGKIQETQDLIKEGKNPGKKNATTAVEQAQKEAQAKWEKQLKKGYVKTIAEAMAGAVDEVIEGGISPMLAHRFDEQGHKIRFPALAQPKFDGHRCIAVVKDGNATLWSRTRKPITGVPHVITDIEALMALRGLKNVILDGELYNHAYKDNFEALTSFIRQEEPKPGHEVVEYHVYDLAGGYDGMGIDITRLHQGARLGELLRIFNDGHKFGSLRRVETISVESEDDLMEAFERFLAQGYEGLMVRNAMGAYVNKRSYDLQKVKEFMDAEFDVVGVEEGRGKLAGHAIFVCSSGGTEFRAKMKGETAALKKYWENPSLAVGRKLTIKFQGWTKTGVVPRFPVAIRFREDV